MPALATYDAGLLARRYCELQSLAVVVAMARRSYHQAAQDDYHCA